MSYTLPGHSTVTVSKGQPTMILSISGTQIASNECQFASFTLRGTELNVQRNPSSCPTEVPALANEQFDVLTGTPAYTVDLINLTFTQRGVGTLVFVSDCDRPSVTPASGVMQPMYVRCPGVQMQQGSGTQ